jgi:hypothetical protein
VLVLNIIQANIVQQDKLDASNIGVTTVAAHILYHNAQSKHSCPFEYCNESNTETITQISNQTFSSKPRLPNKGPTPVKPSRLSYWLEGYDHNT